MTLNTSHIDAGPSPQLVAIFCGVQSRAEHSKVASGNAFPPPVSSGIYRMYQQTAARPGHHCGSQAEFLFWLRHPKCHVDFYSTPCLALTSQSIVVSLSYAFCFPNQVASTKGKGLAAPFLCPRFLAHSNCSIKFTGDVDCSSDFLPILSFSTITLFGFLTPM